MALSATSRETGLESAVGRIQARFGSAALQRASQPATRELEPGALPDAVSTGIAAIDAITGVGGLPNGRLSMCLGAGGSGKTLVAYHYLASLSRQTAAVLWLDLTRQADPWLMGRVGAQLDRVLMLRPPAGDADTGPTLEAALTLVRAGVGGLVVDLSPGAARNHAWDPMAANLATACARTGIPFFAVGELAGDPLRYAASMVLRVERRGWTWSHGDVTGIRLHAVVEKNKVGIPGRSAEVQLDYPLGGFFIPHREAVLA